VPHPPFSLAEKGLSGQFSAIAFEPYMLPQVADLMVSHA